MKIFAWNCRGLGQPRTVQDLERLLRAHRPKLLFLSETRHNKVALDSLRWRLGLKHCVSFIDEGKGGGVALFWDESIDVELLKINSRVIDVMIHDQQKNMKWRSTFVYGEPRRHQRYLMWDLLKKMKPMQNAPWLMLGYFNEVMYVVI
jgi:hypothetical protein